MATIQASSLLSSSLSSSSASAFPGHIRAAASKSRASHLSVLKLPYGNLVHEPSRKNGFQTINSGEMKPLIRANMRNDEANCNSKVVEELYAIMEAVADRSEMHKNIGVQRDNWNRLLLNSVNGMTFTAATMAGLAFLSGGPSQLAEEQRNAARLFKNLHQQIKTVVAVGSPSLNDVNAAMEKVLALDKAYPLPLLGTMLEKFPKTVEPAVWWPREVGSQHEKRKDAAEYVRLSKLVLKVNKILAICGPLFTGIAAMGSAMVGSSPWNGSWAVVFGALATVVNTLEHGGQVGMVFEMYRSTAGYFQLMEETIESTLKEKEVGERENGELFEVKVALQLGRSLPGLQNLANTHSPSSSTEFASKLF
ncbi:putative F-box protein [Vitis vinifera]|uniref:Putative F-box protein n=1 Tax=Vitis vinifera TaxID=29760 RepID=A0A438DXV2_VITVI|nr:putative F-box protein [Vitis vinifera]